MVASSFFVVNGPQIKICFQAPEGGLYLPDYIVGFPQVGLLLYLHIGS